MHDWTGPGRRRLARSRPRHPHQGGTPDRQGDAAARAAAGRGCVEVLDADLKANVPLIGGKLEKAAADPIHTAIGIETRLLREWLAR